MLILIQLIRGLQRGIGIVDTNIDGTRDERGFGANNEKLTYAIDCVLATRMI